MAFPRRPIALAALAAAMLALSLAACGEKDEPVLSELPPPPEPPEEEFDILGEWSGELRQEGVRPFAVTATIASLEQAQRNTVRYGGEIGCAGTWEFLGRRQSAFRFREVIDQGRGGKCKGVGTVTLVPSDPSDPDSLDYEFRGGGVESAGALTRR